MAINRDKFKRTSVAQMQQEDQELNRTLGKKKNDDDLSLDEGPNLLRIYPAHPKDDENEEPDSFIQPMVRTFLPAMVQERDAQGNPIFEDQAKKKPKLKKGVKPVFNSKVHASTPKDLVEEYIKLATSWAKANIDDDKERQDYLDKVYGSFAKKINGINYQTQFMMYVDKYPGANPDATPIFGRIGVKQSIKDRINKIAALESAGDPLGVEPYTDIEDGRAIKIMYNPKAEKAQDYYTTEIDTSQTTIEFKGRQQKVLRTYPLSDEQLERFMKAKSLAAQFKNSFTRKDFEMQVAGLQIFDKDNNMRLWNTPEWAEIVEEIDTYYPEIEEGEDADAPMGEGKPGKYNDDLPFDTEDDEEEGEEEEDSISDDLTIMSRAELISYSKASKTGLVFKTSMSDDMIREKIREWRAVNEIEAGEDVEGAEEEQAPEEPEVKPTKTTGNSAKDRLAKFKKEGGK